MNDKVKYEARGWSKFAQADDYEAGCDRKSAGSFSGRDTFEADTVEELIEKVRRFAGGSVDSVDRDSCDEVGRVDVVVTENDDAEEASPAEIAAWKEGRKRLWYSVYTFYVERVAREAVSAEQKVA